MLIAHAELVYNVKGGSTIQRELQIESILFITNDFLKQITSQYIVSFYAKGRT
jgi:hypothetical protein